MSRQLVDYFPAFLCGPVVRRFVIVLPLLTVARNALPEQSRTVAPPLAPSALELQDLSGQTHRLSELAGRVVIVDFWTTWCPPCLREIPALVKLKADMSGRPFEIVAVNSGEPKDRVRRLKHLWRQGIFVLLDTTGEESRTWSVDFYPTTFIIGPGGAVARRAPGEVDWDGPEARGWIEELMPDRLPN